MRKNKALIKLTLFFHLLLMTCFVFASPRYKDNDINIRVNGAYYLMDGTLVSDGYGLLKKTDASVSVIYKNEAVSMKEFYMSSMGPDIAIKLYVELSHTLKKANVFLNAKPLTKTDENGMAFVEKHKQAGPYELKVSDDKKSLNYFFALDKSMKLVCVGVDDFQCNKVPY